MKKLYITADFNDADYSYRLIVIDEETFDKFLPLIEAINNFEPYVRRSRYGGVDYNNWEGHREDSGRFVSAQWRVCYHQSPAVLRGLLVLPLVEEQTRRNEKAPTEVGAPRARGSYLLK